MRTEAISRATEAASEIAMSGSRSAPRESARHGELDDHEAERGTADQPADVRALRDALQVEQDHGPDAASGGAADPARAGDHERGAPLRPKIAAEAPSESDPGSRIVTQSDPAASETK